MDPLELSISRRIWETRYRLPGDASMEDTWRRVARTLAAVEPRDRDAWAERFHGILQGFRFIPGGRILAGAGSDLRVTLLNCFVMGIIEDSLDAILESLKEGAITMQQGGGVGYDFSTLRPRGTLARGTGTVASGPVSFMHVWDSLCATLVSTGARRGAMMATLRCDHPDIEEFIDAKRQGGRLKYFNLSVLAGDDFMAAVRADSEWPLVFPASHLEGTGSPELVPRRWTGEREPVPCRVFRRVRARALWERIMRDAYLSAEPGILFVDRINRLNNLWYAETISATNPCGEIPLPAFGACDLGSINLAAFVREPFTPAARLDLEALERTARLATRMLDNVLDASRYPLPAQAEQAHRSRRVGLGITGLADALILLGLHYGEPEGRLAAARAMETLCHAAYRASVELAREKGAFPAFERERYLEGEFVRRLPEDIRRGIRDHGLRNSHLVALAPAGTISFLANNVSSGVEPVFDFSFRRRVLEPDGSTTEHELTDLAFRKWRERHGSTAALPRTFVTALELSPEMHLLMQAALQPFVDSAISKTINVPEGLDFSSFNRIYDQAYELGVKGCTVFRPNPFTGEVMLGCSPIAENWSTCSPKRGEG